MAATVAGGACCGAGIATIARGGYSLQRREHPHALGDGNGKELCLPYLADLQTGAGAWRARPQRGEGGFGRVCQHLQENHDRRQGDGC